MIGLSPQFGGSPPPILTFFPPSSMKRLAFCPFGSVSFLDAKCERDVVSEQVSEQNAETAPWSRLYTAAAKDGYPPEWHDTIKHAVREDAGHRCVRCLHPYEKGAGEWSPCDAECKHDEPVSYVAPDGTRYGRGENWPLNTDMRRGAHWRILTVHHLDGNKLNCRWWNLAALCQRCHLQIQGKVQMERVYPWPHSEWFRPYVAGYYAWTYLGQELTREEAADRLEELLGLELAA